MLPMTRIVHSMSIVQAARTKPQVAPDRERLAGEMIAEFRLVLRELKCVGSQRLLRRGVSMTHLHVMSMLERHGAMPMTHLADALDVSVSNATGLVDRMEERGLVDRLRDDADRRVVRVELTAEGRTALAEIEVLQADVLGEVLDRLDDRQLARLARTLEDLRRAVARATTEAPDVFAHEHPSPDPVDGTTPASRRP
jgi:DNA-binding MarR family transcriptional regulator